MTKHLIFYDGSCGLCNNAVQYVLRKDNKGLFLFAPLNGITAEKILRDLPAKMKNRDSFILVENYLEEKRKFLIMGKAALRVCWLLGGKWKLLGFLFWTPSFIYNWVYKIVANNRLRIQAARCTLINKEISQKFLP